MSVVSSQTLFAVWSGANPYDAKFNLDGGSWFDGKSDPYTTTYTIERDLNLASFGSQAVYRNGYDFAGWLVTSIEGNGAASYSYGGWTVGNT